MGIGTASLLALKIGNRDNGIEPEKLAPFL
jgi:hypothetical protein